MPLPVAHDMYGSEEYADKLRSVHIQDSLPHSPLPITYMYNFNVKLKYFANASAITAANTGANAIALPVHSYRQAKK